MELLIDIWAKIGYIIYFPFWIGSIVIYDVSEGLGMIIGAIAWVIWLIVLQIFWWIENKEWIWQA
jgi:hypothetical protein